MNSTATAPAAASPSSDGSGRESGHCELLGPFALFVQGALGALALLVLIWKRSRESPQRPLLVWFMDVSKQVIGAILVHIANLLLSLLSSGSFTTQPTPQSVASVRRLVVRREESGPDAGNDDKYHSNPCSFYLLNLGIDTTIGVVILIYILRLLHRLVALIPIPGLRSGIISGYYGDPPRWDYWGKQAAIYFVGLMLMKFVVWLIFAVCPWLGRVGDFLLAWTEGNRQLQVFFVMFFFPLVMNAFQYYVIDSFIKLQDTDQAFLRDSAPADDEPGLHHPRGSFNYEEDEDGDAEADASLLPRKNNTASTSTRTLDDETDTGNTPPSSGYFGKGSGPQRIKGTIGSQKSRNSSLMMLPGSRGPSTPGYPDDDDQRSGGGASRASRTFADDESTLVAEEERK